ncbi:MAG: hypothetical protein R3C49_24185 [Planctomycetaceae bacterium]
MSQPVRFLSAVRILCAVAAVQLPVPADEKPAIIVPAGFRVDHFADDDLAHDIHSLTFDSQGHVVVSGPGYVRVLLDENNDGRAEGFRVFANGPESGAQGMYFMGPHLLCSGDGGLQIYSDDNGDGIADAEGRTFLKMAAGGEHHVHSIQKGPDGWWYIIAGNMTGIDGSYATLATSPLSQPEAGVLMRLKPDLSGGEVICDGMRNAYDFAFSESGDVFTFDSDGERDVSLPWYQPARILQLTPRSSAGWVSRNWKRPGSFPDMVPVLAGFDRASPTGMICYRHRQFPSRYEGALFALDWTFGRILVLSLEGQRGGWKAGSAVFARSGGQFGFAPTDAAVGPDGSLYVSVGGRGTRGSVYRIVYEAGENNRVEVPQNDATEQQLIDFLLTAPQPGSSWSRTNWYPVAMKLGKNAIASAATDEGRRPIERVRAIEILTDVFDGPDAATTRVLTASRSVPVRARTAWAIGRANPSSPFESAMLTLLNDRDPLVARCALESLTTVRDSGLLDRCLPRLAVCLGSEDSAVRRAAAAVLSRLNQDQTNQLSLLLDANLRSRVWMELGLVSRSDEYNEEAVKVASRMLQDRTADVSSKLEALRLLQLGLGDVGPQKNLPGMFESYRARADLDPHESSLNAVRTELAAQLPAEDPEFNRELIRTIAMLGSLNRDLISRLLQGMTETSIPSDDIHRLAALARVQAPRTEAETRSTAQALVNLEIKIRLQKLKQDLNWDDRLTELYDELCRATPGLADVIASRPGFGQPGHVMFLKNIPAEKTQEAIDGFVATINSDPNFEWTSDVIFVLGRSTRPTHKQLVRDQADNPSVRDAALIVMAREPRAEDRPLFLDGLNSVQLRTVEAGLNALTQLPRSNDAAEQFTLLAVARRLHNDEKEFALREKVIRLLENNTVQTFQFVYGESGYNTQPEAFSRIQQFLAQRYPNDAPRADGGKTAAAIMSVLPQVPWSQGNVQRGAALFARLQCTRCHGGRQALGPDLQGVAKRFSREDLFAAIVDPDRDISSRYQLTTVQTKSGRSISGLVVYESVDCVILRDSDHQTHRIEVADIDVKVVQRRSLMPAELLKNPVDLDLADLDAYLRSL